MTPADFLDRVTAEHMDLSIAIVLFLKLFPKETRCP